MAVSECPKCGRIVHWGARTCPGCGSESPASRAETRQRRPVRKDAKTGPGGGDGPPLLSGWWWVVIFLLIGAALTVASVLNWIGVGKVFPINPGSWK
jgi:hypothetical protein